MENLSIPVNKNTKGLIFDCDGTLADTMGFHMEAWQKAFSKFGKTCPEAFLEPLKGLKEKNIVDLFNKKFEDNLDCQKFLEEKHLYFRSKLKEVKPIEPVVEIVKTFFEKLPMAVVSGGTRTNVLMTLEVIGLDDFFDVILTADDHLKPKPFPDILIEAAWQLKLNPADCQVFEDGEFGLKAARDAGMIATDIRPYL